jgi:tetratricopeptide (TPR) repeat protein
MRYFAGKAAIALGVATALPNSQPRAQDVAPLERPRQVEGKIDPVEVLIEAAERAYRLERFPEAIEKFDQVRAARPDAVPLQVLEGIGRTYARIYRDSGLPADRDRGLEAYRMALKKIEPDGFADFVPTEKDKIQSQRLRIIEIVRRSYQELILPELTDGQRQRYVEAIALIFQAARSKKQIPEDPFFPPIPEFPEPGNPQKPKPRNSSPKHPDAKDSDLRDATGQLNDLLEEQPNYLPLHRMLVYAYDLSGNPYQAFLHYWKYLQGYRRYCFTPDDRLTLTLLLGPSLRTSSSRYYHAVLNQAVDLLKANPRGVTHVAAVRKLCGEAAELNPDGERHLEIEDYLDDFVIVRPSWDREREFRTMIGRAESEYQKGNIASAKSLLGSARRMESQDSDKVVNQCLLVIAADKKRGERKDWTPPFGDVQPGGPARRRLTAYRKGVVLERVRQVEQAKAVTGAVTAEVRVQVEGSCGDVWLTFAGHVTIDEKWDLYERIKQQVEFRVGFEFRGVTEKPNLTSAERIPRGVGRRGNLPGAGEEVPGNGNPTIVTFGIQWAPFPHAEVPEKTNGVSSTFQPSRTN